MKSKRIYFCEVAWDHEVGECEVQAFSHPKQCDHHGCGIIEARVSFVRRVRKEQDVPGKWIPIDQLKHRKLQSIRLEMARLKKIYAITKKEPGLEKRFKKKRTS
jgi:hypothetical protein